MNNCYCEHCKQMTLAVGEKELVPDMRDKGETIAQQKSYCKNCEHHFTDFFQLRHIGTRTEHNGKVEAIQV